MRITLVSLIALTLQVNSFVIGERVYSFAGDDEFYSSYQLSPLLPALKKANTNYQLNQQGSNVMKAVHTSGNAGLNLQAQPSIISPSASIPFVVFGSASNAKKISKKVAGNSEKPVYSPVPKSQDTVDWSAEDMMQHPIDEAPRKVSIT